MHFRQHFNQEFLIILWLGILTGAMLVSLIFTYLSISNEAFQSSLLRTSTKLKTATEITMPNEFTTTSTSNGITMPNE